MSAPRRDRSSWVLAVLGVIVVVGVGFAIRSQFRPKPGAVAPLDSGDREIAWIHTTTTPQNWERFVAGVERAIRQVPGAEVDTSSAFLDDAGVPEVVVRVAGKSGKLHFRWYKLSSEVGHRDWVAALSRRDPPPLAFMGGVTSDRAIDLARALADQSEWMGPRPLFFITTATADHVNPNDPRPERLIDIYPGRTFRGCFTDEAMARAVVDFVWQADDLRPTSKAVAKARIMAWQDDPYSVDLAAAFHSRLTEQRQAGMNLDTVREPIEYSIGTFFEPNRYELRVIENIIGELTATPEDRSLLVVPAVTQPARRVIRAFAADSPMVGQRLVAITGDGVSFNTTYRDGDVAWPVRELSIPLVFFAHQSPVAWGKPDEPGALLPPNSTDDVLLAADIVRLLTEATFEADGAFDADRLMKNLATRQPAFFTVEGERRGGDGEHVVVVRPQFLDGGRVAREAIFDVHARRSGKWELVRRLVR